MGYVYQQQPEPTNFTGVTVTLTAIDPNHNFVTLGHATTDASGVYHSLGLLHIPGTYSITATFAGTNGYYGSSAQTAMDVAELRLTTSSTATPVTGQATIQRLTYRDRCS